MRTLTDQVMAPAPGGGPWYRDRAVVGGVVLMVAVSVALASSGLTTRALSSDEAATRTFALIHGSAGISGDGGNMAVYYLLMGSVLRVFGHSLLALRIPSVVFGAGTVPLVAALAYRLGGRRTALVASVAFVVSLPLVAWQQQARGYTLGMMLVAAAALAYLRLLETGTVLAGMWFVLFTELAGYTLLFSWWVFLAEASLLLTARRSMAGRARAAPWVAVSAVLALPLALIATSRGAGQLSWLRRPGATGLLSGLRLVASGDSGALLVRYATVAIVLTGLSAALWVIAAVESGKAARPVGDRPERLPVALCISWIVTPIAGAWIVSMIWHPVFLDRYFLISLPAAAVLTGIGIDRVWHRWRPAGIGATGTILALHLVLMASVYRS